MELSTRDAIRELAARRGRATSRALCSGFLALVLVGCMGEDWPEPPPVVLAEFAQEHQEFRENRRERLVRPFSGVVMWMGLWELDQGATPFGLCPPATREPAAAGRDCRRKATGQAVLLI